LTADENDINALFILLRLVIDLGK